MTDPTRIEGRDFQTPSRLDAQPAPGRPRTWRCSECEREADDIELRGGPRPPDASVRTWVVGDQRYYGALCDRHTRLDRCRVYLDARRRKDSDPGRLSELEAIHDRRVGSDCVCAEVVRRRKAADEKPKQEPLHPCASGCNRMLVYGVNRCFTCSWKLRQVAAVQP